MGPERRGALQRAGRRPDPGLDAGRRARRHRRGRAARRVPAHWGGDRDGHPGRDARRGNDRERAGNPSRSRPGHRDRHTRNGPRARHQPGERHGIDGNEPNVSGRHGPARNDRPGGDAHRGKDREADGQRSRPRPGHRDSRTGTGTLTRHRHAEGPDATGIPTNVDARHGPARDDRPGRDAHRGRDRERAGQRSRPRPGRGRAHRDPSRRRPAAGTTPGTGPGGVPGPAKKPGLAPGSDGMRRDRRRQRLGPRATIPAGQSGRPSARRDSSNTTGGGQRVGVGAVHRPGRDPLRERRRAGPRGGPGEPGRVRRRGAGGR